MAKILGFVLTFGGLLIALYYNQFSPTAPNLDLALAGWLVWAVGLAILVVQRFKSQRGSGDQERAG
ncbi:hypothetical protein ACW7G2_02145 [Luteimonas sp. A277]